MKTMRMLAAAMMTVVCLTGCQSLGKSDRPGDWIAIGSDVYRKFESRRTPGNPQPPVRVEVPPTVPNDEPQMPGDTGGVQEPDATPIPDLPN